MTILYESANLLGSVNDLEGIRGRRQCGQHLRLVHGQIYAAKLHERMTASQQTLGIHVGDSAGGCNVEVTPHQDGAHRRARLDWFRLLDVADGAGTHDGHNSCRLELRGKAFECVFAKPAKY